MIAYVMGHFSYLWIILAVAGIVAVIIYVPSPIKQYAVAAIGVVAVSSQIFAFGYQSAETTWKAKYDTDIAKINQENQQAQTDALELQHLKDAANEKTLRDALDKQEKAAAENESNYQTTLNTILSAPLSSDADAPDLILKAIRGSK